MDIGRLGVWTFAFAGVQPDDLRNGLKELEDVGYGTVWFPGGGAAFRIARRLLGASEKIKVASGIVSIYAYEAPAVAEEHKGISEEYPDRFLLGLGVSHPEAVNRQGTPRYTQPIAAMSGFLDDLDAAAGSPISKDAVLAALRPRMTDLAKTRTRGAHPYFVPVEHTERARAGLGAGPLLAPEQAIVVESDPSTARRVARGHMTGYLRLQNYANNLRSLGWTDEDLGGGGSDKLVDAIVAWGDAEKVASRIRAHWDAGADHVCVQALSAEPGVPSAQWRALAEALKG